MTGRLRKSGFCILLITLVTGCAGRAADPVIVYQYADKERSCDALARELELIEEEIRKLLPETDETHKNVALGISGMFLIVPWFFMDLSDAEQTEVNALRKRYNHLLALGEEKDCAFDREQIPPFHE